MCAELFSDSKNCLGQEENLRNKKNFDLENYSTYSRKLSSIFSLIYCFTYYFHSICSISMKRKVFLDLVKLQHFCISPT